MATELELREVVEWITDNGPGWDGRNMVAVQRLAGAITELVSLRACLREIVGNIAAIEDTDPARRALRLALAECVKVMREDAHGGDGWSEEGYRALALAAPLLGIDIVRTSTGDEMGEEFKFLLDPPIEAVADALRRGAS